MRRSKSRPDQYSAFADALRRGRLSQNWVVAQAAQACHYSDQQWRNFEAGKMRPQLNRLEQIAGALDLDPLKVFRLWASESLDSLSSRKLRRSLGGESPPQENYQRLAGKLTANLRQLPSYVTVDEELTADFAAGAVELFISLSRRTFAPKGTHKDLKVVCAHDEAVSWCPIQGKTSTRQAIVSRTRSGVGHFAALFRFEAGRGAFHQHADGPYLGAGREFFAVVSGEGRGFFQHPTKRDQWKQWELGPGVVGAYPGNRGHCYVNDRGEPLVVFIVVVPFLPLLKEGEIPLSRLEWKWAQGVEFRIDEMQNATLPEELKHLIHDACVI